MISPWGYSYKVTKKHHDNDAALSNFRSYINICILMIGHPIWQIRFFFDATVFKAAMGSKPVIVSMALSNPAIVAAFETQVFGILDSFGVQDQALLDIISGAKSPSAPLPLHMRADTRTVEEQKEDVPRDMKCHVDTEGNTYDFAFGLNWKGVIKDSRKTA